SYLPLTEGLLERPHAQVTININGVLTQLLDKHGYTQVLENIKELVKRGQVELTTSAMHHAFLPLLPKSEISRQVEINDRTNKEYFGDIYKPVGFFSPELAVNEKVLNVASEMGYEWITAPKVAHPSGDPTPDKIFEHEKTGIKIFFRNKRVSSLILSAVCRSAQDLIKETQDLHEKDKYWFCVMDAETFGHHRIGHEKLLFEILDRTEFFEPTTPTKILDCGLEVEKTDIRPSTWTNEEQDLWEAKSFILWKDPSNPIHNVQWELLDFILDQIDSFGNKNSLPYQRARDLLDKAVASDQFWWASAKPWWSLEMIEQGAFDLKDVVNVLDPGSEGVQQAEKLYRKILDLAFDWQRTGYVRKMHMENSGTYKKASLKDRTSSEWYNQLILEFEKEMNDCAKRQDFEKAIKWRDAVLKISLGTDKYDILHVLDELWTGRNVPWAEPQVKPFLDHKWSEFSDFAKEHFRSREADKSGLSEEEFEKWAG
ncbi:UvrB/UvrC motif-containing protein, partial [bacterium]|nr:UvrB/UvrC motif-containing protein [bacterium]